MPQSGKLCLACGAPMRQLARICTQCGADQTKRPGAPSGFGKAQAFGQVQAAGGSKQSGGSRWPRREQDEDPSFRFDNTAGEPDDTAPEDYVGSLPAAIASCFAKYATFRGRANRTEYWYFNLFLTLVSLVLAAMFQAVALFSFIGAIWGLFVFLPSLAVSVRRLHDTDRSGVYVLLGTFGGLLIILGVVLAAAAILSKDAASGVGSPLLIFIGFALLIWQLVLYCLPGTPGPNRYGNRTSRYP